MSSRDDYRLLRKFSVGVHFADIIAGNRGKFREFIPKEQSLKHCPEVSSRPREVGASNLGMEIREGKSGKIYSTHGTLLDVSESRMFLSIAGPDNALDRISAALFLSAVL